MTPRKPSRAAGRRPPTPFPWDVDLPANQQRIQRNFDRLRHIVVEAALDGKRPTSEDVRAWHRASLAGVKLAEAHVAGGYRGEGDPQLRLARCQSMVGYAIAEFPERVPGRVEQTFSRLNERLRSLDARLDSGETVAGIYGDVIEVCAWLHGEWVRIHPFVDHNGSTARLLTITVALVYGIPLDLPGKPRSALPEDGMALDYSTAAENQMLGNDQNMVVLLHRLASI